MQKPLYLGYKIESMRLKKAKNSRNVMLYKNQKTNFLATDVFHTDCTVRSKNWNINQAACSRFILLTSEYKVLNPPTRYKPLQLRVT